MPFFDTISTGFWSALTCSKSGKIRARASLAVAAITLLDGRKRLHHRKPSLVQRLGKFTLDANRRGRIAARLVLSPRRRMQG